MKVANKKIIRSLSIKSMKSAGVRNRIAVLAIVLTTVLFTALFTIAISVSYSFQQSNFRQIGGYAHGGFKYLTRAQYDELKTDPLIYEYGTKLTVGSTYDEPFNREHVEINYFDENCAKFYYMDFAKGGLPAENTNGAAVDTKVLELLGVEPSLGAEFEMTFDVGTKSTTQTFTLSGWWEYDPMVPARQMAIPKSRAEAIFDELGITEGSDPMAATYSLDVMFKNSANIRDKLIKILENHGYQTDNAQMSGTYINIGVNWGYISAQLNDKIDPVTVISLVTAILLIVFTGYLIIYNVFQISVANDIRSYGLLKTIGTTGRQIRRIVRIQSLLLSLIGIPIGLAIGYGIGALLAPIALSIGDDKAEISISPWIFIFAVIFSLVTVIISCRKPAKLAGKVSPIEALRYTEGSGIRKKKSSAKKGASLFKMAVANLGRNKGKTIVTIASMALAVLLFQMTVIFTGGFDMDKYLRDIVVDFMIGDPSVFQAGGFRNPDRELSENAISEINANAGIIDGGRAYAGIGFVAHELTTEENFRNSYWNISHPQERTDFEVEKRMLENGLLGADTNLYGMEDYLLEKLILIDGDISKLSTGGRYIAAVYHDDDYGNVIENSNWAKVGDKVTIRYLDEFEYYEVESWDKTSSDYYMRPIEYRDVEYEVAATVVVPKILSYRRFGVEPFIMGADTFINDTRTDYIMYYAFDTTDEARGDMEAFLTDYTENVRIEYGYESKKSNEEEFYSFRNMFRLMGGVLSFIVGMVGVLNFFNAILTGIITRRHEFAVLQSVGMTGKQLNKMLVIEGLLYALGAVAVSAVLSITAGPMIGGFLGDILWLFSYKFTIIPILAVTPFFVLLGVTIPLITYRLTSKKSVVERLREVA